MRAFLPVILLLLGLAFFAAPAHAQRWTSQATDDGVWFFADAAPPGRGIEFHCGGRSPQNRPFAENPIGEPMVTPTGQIMLSISTDHVAITQAPRSDIALVIDGREFWLPEVRYSEFEGVHEAPLDINDPVFAALRKGRRVTLAVGGAGGPSWALSGSSAAIRDMALHCVPRWQDPAGPPLPFTANRPPAPRIDPFAWDVEIRADVDTIAVAAAAPASNLSIGCTRPNQSGLDATENPPTLGPVTPPGSLAVAIYTLSLPPPPMDGPGPHQDIFLGLDGALFRLPPLTYGGSATWTGIVTRGDPVIAALSAARQVRIFKGSEQRGEFPTQGLPAALEKVLTLCAGDSLTPDALAQATADPAYDPMQAVDRYLADWCPSGATLDPEAVIFGDLDRDGRDDAILDASGYICDGMRPSCGAAFCSALVFLSSRGMADPLDYLTIGVGLTEAGGQPALRLDFTMSTCSNPFVLEGCSAETLVYRNGRMTRVDD